MHALALLILPTLFAPAPPHDGPARRIAAINKRIAAQGASASLLYQRAMCRVVLRQNRRALADLEGVLALAARHVPAALAKVRVLIALKRPAAALAAAAETRTLATQPGQRSELALACARIHTARGRHREALPEVQRALASTPHDPAALLHRCLLRIKLGQQQRGLAELESYFAVAPQPLHPVVEEAWLEASLAAGKIDRALPLVEARLADCRFRGRWWIRRARIRRLGGDDPGAEADLRAALREIEGRLVPSRPDLLLLADRTLARALLGRPGAARADLASLRARSFPALLGLQLELAMAE